MVILVVGFAGLMEIVQASYVDDRMARAARAAARAMALNQGADACAAIRRELDLAEDFDCDAARWTLTVDLGVGPDSLPATLDESAAAGTGDMVLVRIAWDREPLSFGGLVREADPDDTEVVPEAVAIGLARCEVELCGQTAS